MKAENAARLKTLSQHFNGQMKEAAQSALELTAVSYVCLITEINCASLTATLLVCIFMTHLILITEVLRAVTVLFVCFC